MTYERNKSTRTTLYVEHLDKISSSMYPYNSITAHIYIIARKVLEADTNLKKFLYTNIQREMSLENNVGDRDQQDQLYSLKTETLFSEFQF